MITRATTTLALVLVLGLAACGGGEPKGGVSDQTAGPSADLLSYLPVDSKLIGSADLVQARKDLKLPADTDPLKIDVSKGLAAALKSPQLQLSLIAADGFGPLAVQLVSVKPDPVTKAVNGTEIAQAASNRLDLKEPVSVIRTTQPFDEIAHVLAAGYKRDGNTLVAKDPKSQVTSIADAGDGIIVFAGGAANAAALVKSPPGGPPALVDLISSADEPDAIASTPPSRSCITAFGGWNAPDGSGTLALSIDGDASSDSFHESGLQGAPITLGEPAFSGDRIKVPFTRDNDSLATSGNILEQTIRGNIPLGGLYDCP